MSLLKKDSNTIAISSYYLRDNRIFEYFIALKYIQYWHLLNPGSNEILNRKKMEEHLKRQKQSIMETGETSLLL